MYILFYLLFIYRRPTNLYVVWTRRSRRVISTQLSWEPDLVDPLTACMSWPVPDNHTVAVTLFRDARTRELEDKDWTFAIEDVSQTIFFNIKNKIIFMWSFLILKPMNKTLLY